MYKLAKVQAQRWGAATLIQPLAWELPCTRSVALKRQNEVRVPLWLSRLRILPFHCSDLGLIPSPRTFACHRHSQKKKTKTLRQLFWSGRRWERLSERSRDWGAAESSYWQCTKEGQCGDASHHSMLPVSPANSSLSFSPLENCFILQTLSCALIRMTHVNGSDDSWYNHGHFDLNILLSLPELKITFTSFLWENLT